MRSGGYPRYSELLGKRKHDHVVCILATWHPLHRRIKDLVMQVLTHSLYASS